MEADTMARMTSNPNRRRFIAVSAASAAMTLTAGAQASPQQVTWKGVALGAEAQIRLCHADAEKARRALGQCVAEIRRLENIFSLYRPDSTLSRLNRLGRVQAPEIEFVQLVSEAIDISRQTGGAFDPTVQPLWQLYRQGTPTSRDIAATLELVGTRHIEVTPQHISLTRPGATMTLNGIAQGYITDRVAGLLQHAGFADILIDLGEAFGNGSRPDGRPWQAAIEGSDERIALSGRAIATSSPTQQPGFHHLFDPGTGRPADRNWTATVLAPSATVADALSTAFTILDERSISRVLSERRDSVAILVTRTGKLLTLASPPSGAG
jgi:thiamine biosynthesis lipoprotein